MELNKKILEYLLKNLNDKDLNVLIKELNIQINGFSNIKNKNLSIPKTILIKSILNTDKINELKEYFLNDALSIRDYSKINEQEIVNLFEQGKEQKYIIEFLLASLDANYNKIETIVNQYITENKKMVFYENILEEKTKKSDNVDKNLNEENNNLIKKNRKLNKEVNRLNEEILRLKKDIELNKKKLEKYECDFKNIKNKYDEIKENEKELISNNILLRNQKEKLERECIELEIKNVKLNKKLEKRIGVIGEINNNYFNDKRYKIDKITINSIENLNNICEEYKEIWILLYDLPIHIQRKLKNIKKDKIYKFKNFTEFSSYINKGV